MAENRAFRYFEPDRVGPIEGKTKQGKSLGQGKTMKTMTITLDKRLIISATVFLLPLLVMAMAMPALASDSEAGRLASSLPPQIPEIVTGGKWKKGDIGGTYRAVVVMAEDRSEKTGQAAKAGGGKAKTAHRQPQRKAQVFIQWIAYENGRANPHIVKSVSVREFNEKQLRHAFLAMDTLNENEMTLLVTSYDEKNDKDVSIKVKATAPGQYHPTK